MQVESACHHGAAVTIAHGAARTDVGRAETVTRTLGSLRRFAPSTTSRKCDGGSRRGPARSTRGSAAGRRVRLRRRGTGARSGRRRSGRGARGRRGRTPAREEVADRGELGDVRERRRPCGVGPPRAAEADSDERDGRRVGVERGPPVPREQAALRDRAVSSTCPCSQFRFTVALWRPFPRPLRGWVMLDGKGSCA